MNLAAKRRAERSGRLAETLGVLWLRLKGYRILARRLKTPVGEIDILALRGGVLAVVEVKARADLARALDAISPQQWQRLARAVEWAIAHRPDLAERALRFDAILLARGRVPRHVPDAWRPPGSSLS